MLRACGAVAALALVCGALAVFARRGTAALASGVTNRVIVPSGSRSATALPPMPVPTPTAATTTVVPAPTAPSASSVAAAAVTSVAPGTSKTTVAPTSVAATTTTGPAPRWGTGILTMTFVDHSRSTPPAGSDPGGPSRTLPTIVRYPIDAAAGAGDVAGAAASRRGPFPLIVFASGYNTTADEYATLTRSWAAAGYVVAIPAFPRNQMGAPLNEDDVANEPGDISFVITGMIAATRGSGPLAGVIDPAHVGTAGHSDGGVAALGVGYNSCCRDPRISADVVGSGDEERFTGAWYPPGSPPLLVIQGNEDPINPPTSGQQVFQDAHSPKYFLWLLGAGHLEPFTTDLPHLGVVEATTLAFFDRYLKGRAGAAGQLQSSATAGLATLTAG